MTDYSSIIEFENEHSGLDFKAKQYTRDKYPALLKDIIAMANAKADGYRLIIIGVKLNSDGSRTIVPIPPSEFIDSATYEQLIHENIEPELEITYFQHFYQGKLLGIIRFENCKDQPYIMKKDYGDKLKKGTCLVRKGSHQVPSARSDYDRMYEDRQFSTKFHDHLHIGFKNTDIEVKTFTTKVLRELDLPSQRQARKIESIIDKKQELQKTNGNHIDFKSFINSVRFPLGGIPYEERSIETLQEDLKYVKETYAEDDLYELFEHHALKLNFTIVNDANEYVQDATCSIEIPESEGVIIFDEIIVEPQHNPLLKNINLNAFSNIDYPSVRRKDGLIIISQDIGDIKHHLTTQLFKEDIRVAILKPIHNSIPVKIAVYAKNMPRPFETTLTIFIEDAPKV